MKTFGYYRNLFKDYLILKNYSIHTRRAYLSALKKFYLYRINNGLSGSPLTQDQVRDFILERYNMGKSWQTINGDYSGLRLFFREVMDLEWSFKKLPRPRIEKQLPRLISKQEVKLLIENASRYKHQVFITFLYATGLRLSEVLRLKINDINGYRKQIRVEKGKGAKDRYVDIPEVLLNILRQYYQIERPVLYLFNGYKKGIPLSQRTAQMVVKKAKIKAGITKKVSPHILRNCFATHHLENGTDLVFLQQMMGHKHLKTTLKYIRLCTEQNRRIYHPLADMEIKYHM